MQSSNKKSRFSGKSSTQNQLTPSSGNISQPSTPTETETKSTYTEPDTVIESTTKPETNQSSIQQAPTGQQVPTRSNRNDVKEVLVNKADEIKNAQFAAHEIEQAAQSGINHARAVQEVYDAACIIGAASVAQFGSLYMLGDGYDDECDENFSEAFLEDILGCKLDDITLKLPSGKKNSSKFLPPSVNSEDD